MNPSDWSLTTSIVLFFVSGAIIAVCGVMLTIRAERLAKITGLGQAIMGAVFLGMITSLAGTLTSINAALSGSPEIAVGNAIGGIAAQTTFLVLADFLYRRSNLEHAAASEQNLFQGVLLVLLLAIALLASAGPGFTFWKIDLFSPILLFTYIGGLYLLSSSRKEAMWYPKHTSLTSIEGGEEDPREKNRFRLWAVFILLAAIVGSAGWITGSAGVNISRQTGLSETLVGTLFTSVSTSLPELVIALMAARRGAVTLAVGNIIGGNTFDVLFLVASDTAYRGGSIYLAISQQQVFWISMNIVLTAVLLLGLLKRQKHGAANIGFEGVIVLLCYVAAVIYTVYFGTGSGGG